MKKILWFGAAFLVTMRLHAANCTWDTLPTAISFGSYSVFTTNTLAATGGYAFTCTPNSTATVTFSAGSSGTYSPARTMKLGGASVPYNIYDDASVGSPVLGDGASGSTVRVRFNSTPGDKKFTDSYFGRLSQGADIPAGLYTDTINVVVSWGAGSISGSFSVTTTVLAECRVSGATIDFGNYDPIVANATTPKDSSGTVNVFCTKGKSGTLGLGNGANFSGTRRMAGAAGSFLSYDFFTSGTYATPWTTAVTGLSTSKDTAIPFAVFARVPGGQDPTVGLHQDTVQATVNY